MLYNTSLIIIQWYMMAGKFRRDGEFTDEIQELLYVKVSGGCLKGWKTDLLVEKIQSRLEEMFLLCSGCKGVLRDACLVEKDGKQELRCSVCIPDNAYGSKAQMNREAVNEKQVYCPFKPKGCDWTDTITQMHLHLGECMFFPVKCPLRCLSVEENKQGEVNTIERGFVTEHQQESCPNRQMLCEYCGSEVTACEINAHLHLCQSFPIECPNSCGVGRIVRKNMAVHLSKECRLEEIDCPFSQYGCDARFLREHIDRHERESMNSHINIIILRMKSLEHEVVIRDSEISELKDKVYNLQLQGELEWEISGIKKKIENREVSFSDPFYIGKYKCQAEIIWDIEEGGVERVACLLCILKGDFDDELSWPFRFECRYVLLNQQNSENNLIRNFASFEEHINNFEKPSTQRNVGMGVKFISHADLLTDKYTKDDTVFFKVAVVRLPIW